MTDAKIDCQAVLMLVAEEFATGNKKMREAVKPTLAEAALKDKICATFRCRLSRDAEQHTSSDC